LDAAHIQEVLNHALHAVCGAQNGVDALLTLFGHEHHVPQDRRRQGHIVQRVSQLVGNDGEDVVAVGHGLIGLLEEPLPLRGVTLLARHIRTNDDGARDSISEAHRRGRGTYHDVLARSRVAHGNFLTDRFAS
jgi:hypothetical protein